MTAPLPADACTVDDDGCITCGDVAVVLRVVRTDGVDATCEDEHGNREVVAVELVDVGPGDLVLAHARVALDRAPEGTPLGRMGAPRPAGAVPNDRGA